MLRKYLMIYQKEESTKLLSLFIRVNLGRDRGRQKKIGSSKLGNKTEGDWGKGDGEEGKGEENGGRKLVEGQRNVEGERGK